MATFWNPHSPGEAIRILRERMGLSQRQFCERVNALGASLSPEHLSKIERGTRKAQWAHLIAFAYLFDCNITDLMVTADEYDELALHLRGVGTRVMFHGVPSVSPLAAVG